MTRMRIFVSPFLSNVKIFSKFLLFFFGWMQSINYRVLIILFSQHLPWILIHTACEERQEIRSLIYKNILYTRIYAYVLLYIHSCLHDCVHKTHPCTLSHTLRTYIHFHTYTPTDTDFPLFSGLCTIRNWNICNIST